MCDRLPVHFTVTQHAKDAEPRWINQLREKKMKPEMKPSMHLRTVSFLDVCSIRPVSLAAMLCLALASASAVADSDHDATLLVSSSRYAGNVATVIPGVTVTGGVTAAYDGSLPNVFLNEIADPSFGITSGISLEAFDIDDPSREGRAPFRAPRLVGVLDISAAAKALGTPMSTSFPSKSELALHVSTDGRFVSFMGYGSPINQLDVSNSNTPGVLDASNPVTSTVPRAIADVSLDDGALAITYVNAYSGNNGRGTVLANGTHYMVGNAGNSGKNVSNSVLDELSANTGVQALDKKSASSTGGVYATSVVGQPSCSSCAGTGKGYQFGFSISQLGLPADKTGKDDNFRGLTVFNGTLYVTKGSGSNGVNTVYQVGPAQALAGGHALVAQNALISILPGFNTTLAKTAVGGPNPFGIWFANPTTLYVADEGDGVIADAATSSFAGLQKWTFDGTQWKLAYVLKNGLNLGVNYTVTGGLNADGSVNPRGNRNTYTTATDGLRNITGRVNADGTVTLYAVTSTVSSGTGDQGADPNKLVRITDKLAYTSAGQALDERFAELRTAEYGQVLRGVAVASLRAEKWRGHLGEGRDAGEDRSRD
ncbi:hypothetical protein SRS16P3_00050 (plasmid) [Variovorax sp. SRS16]|uniref:hypothetical protein n=1 Tax=Variovorax sp. SRS16 TaxID=282217 RepID=UPI00131920F0|nr:hypothetical protein [Variovorax sp. SRS16]VTU46338.1 hypothetical protein SRS16P3_00050 [Variovorax sp. SRS16]